MENEQTLCVLCAWRATCNKKFSRTGGTSVPCPEYTRDITLRTKEKTSDSPTTEKKVFKWRYLQGPTHTTFKLFVGPDEDNLSPAGELCVPNNYREAMHQGLVILAEGSVGAGASSGDPIVNPKLRWMSRWVHPLPEVE